MFTKGETYRRREIHALFGGQEQGGISTPSNHQVIFLFSGDTGEQYGYRDGWTEDGKYLYTGEGQIGDMAFIRGNRAIRDHEEDGKELHLFEYAKIGHVRYVGQMICSGVQMREGPDRTGQLRKVIVFELTPFDPAVRRS